MRYGYFDDIRREYVITRPDTPLPWINYLGNEAYFGIISNTAGGYSFYKDARLRRLTRYRYNNAPLDLGGRYLYLRDEASGEFWSPTWQPTRQPLEGYTCRHGLGYTEIASTHAGIEARVRYFVPLGENLEIWQATLINQRAQPAELSLFSLIEFCLWDAQDDSTNFQRNYSTGQVEVVDEVIYHKTEYRERRDHFAFFACSEPLAGFDTERDEFLGAYRGWDNPQAVAEGRARNSIAHGWQPIGSHHVRLTLQPGEQRQVIFLLGYQENTVAEKFDPPGSQVVNKRKVRPIIARYLQPAVVAQAAADLAAYWEGLLAHFHGDSGRTHQPHGQHLERLPVCGDLQHVALGFAVRIRHRTRPGLPRLQPGFAGFCSPDPRAGPRAHPRSGCHPTPRRRRVSPVSTADQARQ